MAPTSDDAQVTFSGLRSDNAFIFAGLAVRVARTPLPHACVFGISRRRFRIHEQGWPLGGAHRRIHEKPDVDRASRHHLRPRSLTENATAPREADGRGE